VLFEFVAWKFVDGALALELEPPRLHQFPSTLKNSRNDSVVFDHTTLESSQFLELGAIV
jgi:hypothetical protein